jgi:hypothetical protein
MLINLCWRPDQIVRCSLSDDKCRKEERTTGFFISTTVKKRSEWPWFFEPRGCCLRSRLCLLWRLLIVFYTINCVGFPSRNPIHVAPLVLARPISGWTSQITQHGFSKTTDSRAFGWLLSLCLSFSRFSSEFGKPNIYGSFSFSFLILLLTPSSLSSLSLPASASQCGNSRGCDEKRESYMFGVGN